MIMFREWYDLYLYDLYGSGANLASGLSSIKSRKTDCWRLNSPSLLAQLRIEDLVSWDMYLVIMLRLWDKNFLEESNKNIFEIKSQKSMYLCACAIWLSLKAHYKCFNNIFCNGGVDPQNAWLLIIMQYIIFRQNIMQCALYSSHRFKWLCKLFPYQHSLYKKEEISF